MPATSRSVVGMAHSYKKHYPATPALKESRIASKLAPTGSSRAFAFRTSEGELHIHRRRRGTAPCAAIHAELVVPVLVAHAQP